jgi:hemerythrin
MFDFKFDWVKTLDTGIESLDTQHKQLFKIGRDMEQLLRIQCIGVTDKQLLDIVCELRDFTAYHFYEEERMMDEMCYPRITMHRNFHKKCSDYIMHIDVPALRAHPYEQLKILCDEVQDWIMNHVLSEDCQMADAYKKYVKEMEDKKKVSEIPEAERFGEFVRELDVTKLYLFKDQSRKGHLVAVFKESTRELLRLSALERNLYFADISKAAKIIKKLYEPDALCYVDMEDMQGELAFHIVPKYREDNTYGSWPMIETEAEQTDRERYTLILDEVRTAFKV